MGVAPITAANAGLMVMGFMNAALGARLAAGAFLAGAAFFAGAVFAVAMMLCPSKIKKFAS
jgi:hypothetical protein